MSTSIPTALPSDQGERLIEVLRRAIPLLPREMRSSVAALLTGENLAITTFVFAAWGAAHLVGVGQVVDVGLLAFGVLTLGTMAFEAAGLIGQCLEKSATAKRSSDLDAAAALLASAITLLGAALFNALLMKYAARKGTAVRPSSVPNDMPRYFALTPEEWLYQLGYRRMATRVRAGAATALEFFERRQSFASAKDVTGWLKGMDLSSPVTLAGFDKGTELVGYMQLKPGIVAKLKAMPTQAEQIMASLKPSDFEIGRFFTKPGVGMQKLGIGDQNRVFCRFRVSTPVEALESTTRSTRDTWTVRGQSTKTNDYWAVRQGHVEKVAGTRWSKGQLVEGGAIQYLVPEARYLYFTGQLEMTTSASGFGMKTGVMLQRIRLH